MALFTMVCVTKGIYPKILLACSCLISMAAYYFTAGSITDHDPFVMAEIAQRVARGNALYIDAWDNKPPLSLLYYLPSQIIAPGSYLVQQLFAFLWSAAQALATYFLLRGEKVWIRVIVATLVVWAPLMRWEYVWGSSEDAVNGFTLILAVLGYRKLRDGQLSPRLWVLTGFCAGLAFHTRQPGVLFLALPLLALVLGTSENRNTKFTISAVGLGLSAAFILVIGIMLIISDLTSYVDIMFFAPFRYGYMGSWNPNSTPFQHASHTGARLLLILPLLAILVAKGWRMKIFVIALTVVSIVVVAAPMRGLLHYEQQLIPVFIIGTLIILSKLELSRHQTFVRSLGVLLVIIVMVNMCKTVYGVHRDNGELAELNKIVHIIESESRPGETIFAVGRNAAYIHYRSGLEPAHKFYWDQFYRQLADFLAVDIDGAMAAMIANPPDWLPIHIDDQEKYLLSPEPGKEGRLKIGKLLRGITNQQRYIEFGRVGSWVILTSTNRVKTNGS